MKRLLVMVRSKIANMAIKSDMQSSKTAPLTRSKSSKSTGTREAKKIDTELLRTCNALILMVFI